jgi:hypothetical protein
MSKFQICCECVVPVFRFSANFSTIAVYCTACQYRHEEASKIAREAYNFGLGIGRREKAREIKEALDLN